MKNQHYRNDLTFHLKSELFFQNIIDSNNHLHIFRLFSNFGMPLKKLGFSSFNEKYL